MTMQVNHLYRHNDISYSIVNSTAPIPFDPKDYGIIPSPICTACHSGYWCGFTVTDDRFILNDLFINSKDDIYPPISGLTAIMEDNRYLYMIHHIYRNLHIPIDFTGRILAGRNATPTYYIDGIFGDPWKYKDLKEFIFGRGILKDIIEQSETAKDIRKLIRTMSKSKFSGTLGTYVQLDLGLLKLVSNNAWWIKRL